MLAIAGGILIVVAILAFAWLGIVMLADSPGAGVTVLLMVACAAAYVIF